MSSDPERDAAYAKFTAIGEAEVRQKVTTGHISGKNRRYADAWLAELDAKAAARADAREEESLSISRSALSTSQEANSIARSALHSAKMANIWAAIAALIAAIAIAVSVFM